MEDKEDAELKKYEELYKLAKEVASEELSRAQRLDDKASRYLSVLTFLLGVFVILARFGFSTIVPPQGIVDWTALVIAASGFLSLVVAWGMLFSVQRFSQLEKIDLDVHVFVDPDHRLRDILYAYTLRMKEGIDANREKNAAKARLAGLAYGIVNVAGYGLAAVGIAIFIDYWLQA